MQVNPWDLSSAPLSLIMASCDGDFKIGSLNSEFNPVISLPTSQASGLDFC